MQMESGKTPRAAVDAAVKDIEHLQGGVLRSLVIHAVNREGEPYVVAINPEKPIEYRYWCEGMKQSECRKVDVVKIKSLMDVS